MVISKAGFLEDILEIVPLPEERLLVTNFNQLRAKKISVVNWEIERL